MTPEDAGWDWTGLRVLRLAPGEPTTLRTGRVRGLRARRCAGGLEVAVAEAAGGEFDLDGRRVASSAAVTDFCYVGRDSVVVPAAPTAGAEVALPSSRCERALPPAYGAAEDVPVEVRGAGRATRQVTNFGVPGVWDHADKLICCELITPAGQLVELPTAQARRAASRARWSTRRSTTTGSPARPGHPSRGFGYHTTYTGPEHEAAGLAPIDETLEVRDHDVVLVPHGYHGPCMAAPGYPMYYLNVMAGPARTARWRSATTRPTAGSATAGRACPRTPAAR